MQKTFELDLALRREMLAGLRDELKEIELESGYEKLKKLSVEVLDGVDKIQRGAYYLAKDAIEKQLEVSEN